MRGPSKKAERYERVRGQELARLRFAEEDSESREDRGRLQRAEPELITQLSQWGVNPTSLRKTLDDYARVAKGEKNVELGASISNPSAVLAQVLSPFYAVAVQYAIFFCLLFLLTALAADERARVRRTGEQAQFANLQTSYGISGYPPLRPFSSLTLALLHQLLLKSSPSPPSSDGRWEEKAVQVGS